MRRAGEAFVRRRSYILLSARGTGMERETKDREGQKDRERGLSRRAVVFFGAMLGSYIAGKVFDVIRGRW